MPENQKSQSITSYVAEFIASTSIDDIPAEVIELGKKSILDGLGLAIAGSVAESGRIACRHIESLGCGEGPCTIIGIDMKTAPRFAAFANGLAIHAHDYDDTQLASWPDDKSEAIIETIRNLQELGNVQELTALLAP